MTKTVLIKPPAAHGATIMAGEQAFVFDVTDSETHEQPAKVSKHPVEEGSDITDHVRAEPLRLKMSATLSATPFRKQDQKPDRLATKHDELLALVEAGTPVRVVTGLKAYDDMVLSMYKTTRSSNTGQALDAQLDFVQVRRVAHAEVDIPAGILKRKVRPGGQSKKNKGEQTGTEADENGAESLRGRSWLKSIVNIFSS